MPDKIIAVAVLLACLRIATFVQAADLPIGAAVLDPDIVWDVANPNSFAMSRDGKQIAYISRGAIWLCRVDAGPPTKLANLPNTITAILAEPENKKQREDSAASPHNIRHQVFYGPFHLDKHYVIGLAWARGQNGVFYTVRKRVRENSSVAAYHVMYVSLSGVVEEITAIEGEFGVPDEYTTSIHVTTDRKFVIASAYTPLIWDVLASRPRATPYDLLVPSSTSERFLGIEIDTRQLVLVDEQFQIAKRFDVVFPAEQAVDLTWSENERFGVCRIQDRFPEQHNFYDAIAFRIDLQTGEQTTIGKCNTRDQFLFVSEGDELLHLRIGGIRVWGYFHGELGTKLTEIAHDGTARAFYKTKRIRQPQKGQQGTVFPPLIAAPDGSNVAIAVPRPEDQAPGAHYHLVDRDGQAKPFVPGSDASYITPYYPIAFGEDGRRLIARSGSKLFSVPVSEVAEDREASDDE